MCVSGWLDAGKDGLKSWCHTTTPHRTTPDRTTPHHTAPHHTAPHHTTPHHTTPHHTTPATPHRTTPHHTTPHHTTPHHTTPRHTVACHTAPHHITPHHTTPRPHHSIPYHTTPHHTTPHHTTRHKLAAMCGKVSTCKGGWPPAAQPEGCGVGGAGCSKVPWQPRPGRILSFPVSISGDPASHHMASHPARLIPPLAAGGLGHLALLSWPATRDQQL